ncbi:hypothetical protein BC829DRAFT_283625 [Chytridium lagenaria]|nr:hypothetical protein BC829DRAFT_283625 [Chytridium lagenaria]
MVEPDEEIRSGETPLLFNGMLDTGVLLEDDAAEEIINVVDLDDTAMDIDAEEAKPKKKGVRKRRSSRGGKPEESMDVDEKKSDDEEEKRGTDDESPDKRRRSRRLNRVPDGKLDSLPNQDDKIDEPEEQGDDDKPEGEDDGAFITTPKKSKRGNVGAGRGGRRGGKTRRGRSSAAFQQPEDGQMEGTGDPEGQVDLLGDQELGLMGDDPFSPLFTRKKSKKKKGKAGRGGAELGRMGPIVPNTGNLDSFEASDPTHVSAGGKESSVALAEALASLLAVPEPVVDVEVIAVPAPEALDSSMALKTAEDEPVQDVQVEQLPTETSEPVSTLGESIKDAVEKKVSTDMNLTKDATKEVVMPYKAPYNPELILGKWAWSRSVEGREDDGGMADFKSSDDEETLVTVAPRENTIELFQRSLRLYRRFGDLQFLGTLTDNAAGGSPIKGKKKPRAPASLSLDVPIPEELKWLKDHVFRFRDAPTLDVAGMPILPPTSAPALKMRWRVRKRNTMVEMEETKSPLPIVPGTFYMDQRRSFVSKYTDMCLEDLEEMVDLPAPAVLSGRKNPKVKFAVEFEKEQTGRNGNDARNATVEDDENDGVGGGKSGEGRLELDTKREVDIAAMKSTDNHDGFDALSAVGLPIVVSNQVNDSDEGMDVDEPTGENVESGGPESKFAPPETRSVKKWTMPFVPADDADARRKYFCRKEHREELAFTPDCVYKMELSGNYLDLGSFEFNIFDYRVKLGEHLQDQPLQLICRSKSRGIPFFVIEFSFVP